MANQLPLTNIVNVSVSQTPTGVNSLNASNVGLFSLDQPTGSFSGDDYAPYVDPTQVATDWGSSSVTYQMANAIFSQKPNILTGNGQLVIIPMISATETLVFSGVAASGTFKLVSTLLGGGTTATINWDDTAAEIQTALRALPGYEGVVVTGSIASQTLTIKLWGIYGETPALLSDTANTLQTGAAAPITITPAISVEGETLADAITRTKGLVNYFAILETVSFESIGNTDFDAVAALVQPLNYMYVEVSATAADITGAFQDNTDAGNTHTRCLYYGDTYLNAILMKASYVGRLFCVDFDASGTTLTAQLKQLVGIEADPSMTQTIYSNCLDAGVDCYPSFQGFAGISSSGANSYFDQVYNVLAFADALQVAGFNYLAGTATKIPQTEDGMNGLKGAYRAVCDRYVANGYLAPGSWTSSTTFGNQQNLLNNVSEFGYYIYSSPIALQTQAARVARQAPLVQIAAKEAGAVHTSNILVFINP